MLLSGVRSSCDMLARNSDLYLEVRASSAAFSSSAWRACSISLFFLSTSAFCSASCLAFWASCFVGLLQLLLLGLQFGGQLLRLLQQTFGAHRRFDGVEHDADAFGELRQERQVGLRERSQRGQLDDRLDLTLEQHRQHDDVARRRLAQARADVECSSAESSVKQNASFFHGALADQAFADAEFAAADRRRRRRRIPPAFASGPRRRRRFFGR